MAGATLYLVGSDRLIRAVECDHVHLNCSHTIAVWQSALPAGILALGADEGIRRPRHFESILLPHLMPIAFAQALSQRGFKDTAVPLICRTNDARGPRVFRSSDRVLNKLGLGQCPNRFINDRRNALDEGHSLRPAC
jgi:hypothetical protein